MKTLIIRESSGRYNLENFGNYYTGLDGHASFTLRIESESQGISLEFPETTLFDIFAKFNLRDNDFMEGRFSCPDFVHVKREGAGCVMEAPCGTLFDFFRERAASGYCQLQSERPLRFAHSELERDVA